LFSDVPRGVKIKTGTSSRTVNVDKEGPIAYMVGPLPSEFGQCKSCGCNLQDPSPYDGTSGGSIWLTPWHDCGGHCVVCMAHAEDPAALVALREWLLITDVAAETAE